MTTEPSPDQTMKTMTLKEIKAALRRMRDEESTEQRDERAAHVLSSRFLSEVERLSKERELTRKALAAAIGTSASYVTQLFRGDRNLNLLTAARLQRVLGIEFHVKAVVPINRPKIEEHPAMLRKLPSILNSHRFAESQTQSGGLYGAYLTPFIPTGELVIEDFS